MAIRDAQMIESFAPSQYYDNDAEFYGTGRDAGMVYDTSDANANLLKTDFLAQAGAHVPVHVYGVGVADTDLGFFNGVTEPMVAVVDLALTSWVSMGFRDAGEPAIQIGGSASYLYLPDVVATEITIYSAENLFYLTESDQTAPEGRWRFRVQADIMYLEHALTMTDSAWSTDEDWISYDYANAISTVSKQQQHGLIYDGYGLSTGASGNAVAVYAEVPSGTTISDTVRGIRSRFVINQAQTADCSIFAVEGDCRVKVNLGQGVHTGVFGYFEQSGTVTLASPGINAGGVFTVEAPAALTLNDGAYLAGAVISTNVHTSAGITAASDFHALWIRTAADCKEWNEIIVITTLTAKDLTLFELATEGASFKWDEGEDSFILSDGLILDASTQQSATEVYIVHDNDGDLTLNALTNKTINLAVNGTDEYAFSASSLDMNSNHLDNCGYIVLNAVTPTSGEVQIWNESDGELHLNAVTGKSIVFEIADAAEMALNGSALTVDVINELTSGVGVTVEGVLLKDTHIQFANATNPADTITYISRDNSGDLTIHTITGKAVNLAIVGADVLRVEGAKISLLQDIFTDRWASLDSNVYIGVDVCGDDAITSANENVVIGNKAGYSMTSCEESVIIGFEANYTGTTQGARVVIGYKALYAATYDYDVVAIGHEALVAENESTGNTAVGYHAGYNTTTGGDNVYIGNRAGASSDVATASDCIFIGQRTYPPTTVTDGYILIGRPATRAYLLSDNDGDWEIRAMSGKSIDLKIGTTDEYNFGASSADFNANNIDNVGHIGVGGNAAITQIGIYYDESTGALGDNLSRQGIAICFESYKTSAAYTGALYGGYYLAKVESSNTQAWSNTIGLRGIHSEVELQTGTASTSTVTGAASFYARAEIGGATDDMLLTNLYGLYIEARTLVGNSKLTNDYGIYIADQAGGATLNYAIYTNAGLVRFGGAVTLASTLTLGGAITGGAYAVSNLGATSIGAWGAGNGIALTDSVSNVFRVHGEVLSGVDLTAGTVVRAGHTRVLMSNDQSNGNVTIFGFEAQFRLPTGIDLAGGNYGGIWAYYEASGANAITGGGAHFSEALLATVEGNADFNLGASANLCGIIIDSSMDSGATITGNYIGLWLKRKDGMAKAFTYDIKFQNGATLVDDGTDLTLAGSNLVVPTLTATTINAFTAGGTIDMASETLTNVGYLEGVTDDRLYIDSKRTSGDNAITIRTTGAGAGYVDTVRVTLYGRAAETVVEWAACNHTGLKLGGSVELNGQAFDAGSGDAKITTTGSLVGLDIEASNAANGATIKLDHLDTTPVLDSIVGAIDFWGFDGGTPTTMRYGSIRVDYENITNTTEAGRFEVHLATGGAVDNLAMSLTGAGELWIDADLTLDTTQGIKVVGGLDNEYFTILAHDNDAGDGTWVEVARAASATDPYFSMGGSQEWKFYNSGIATASLGISGSITALDITTTTSVTSGNSIALNITHTRDTDSVTGRDWGIKVTMVSDSDAKFPGGVNAVYGSLELGLGGVHGRAAGLQGELVMPDGQLIRGTFSCLHADITCSADTNWGSAGPLSFISCVVGGTKTFFEANAYLLELTGVTEGAGNMCDNHATPTADGAIRCLINGAVRWLLYANDPN